MSTFGAEVTLAVDGAGIYLLLSFYLFVYLVYSFIYLLFYLLDDLLGERMFIPL